LTRKMYLLGYSVRNVGNLHGEKKRRAPLEISNKGAGGRVKQPPLIKTRRTWKESQVYPPKIEGSLDNRLAGST